MLSAYDIQTLLIMGSLGLFCVGFISFMMYQEKKLSDLEKKAKR